MINILSHYELLPVLIRALPPDTSASLLQDKNSLLSSVSSVHWEDPAVSSLSNRAGPQNEKWSDRQITENPTGSIHKEARKKKFDPKKVDFD